MANVLYLAFGLYSLSEMVLFLDLRSSCTLVCQAESLPLQVFVLFHVQLDAIFELLFSAKWTDCWQKVQFKLLIIFDSFSFFFPTAYFRSYIKFGVLCDKINPIMNSVSTLNEMFWYGWLAGRFLLSIYFFFFSAGKNKGRGKLNLGG